MPKCYRAELVGAFGCPIDENPTGVMEEAAFMAKGLNYRYLTIRVREGGLEAAMQAVRALEMRGINLTVPHKVDVLKYLDELSPAATIIGAVNTVVNERGRLWGDNTDGKGFILALEDCSVDVADKNISIFGAGGAARAISVECALAGARNITIINRTAGRGEELAALIRNRTKANGNFVQWNGKVTVPSGSDIIINATTIGLYPHTHHKPEIEYDTISRQMIFADVIFNDPHSLFLQEAEQRGCKTINGLGMLVHQGALNFHLWTGEEPPRELMMNTLRRELGLAAP